MPVSGTISRMRLHSSRRASPSSPTTDSRSTPSVPALPAKMTPRPSRSLVRFEIPDSRVGQLQSWLVNSHANWTNR